MKLKIVETHEVDKVAELSEKIYKLKEKERELEMKISDEQFIYSNLKNNRSIYNASIIKETMIFLYFLVFYALFNGALSINIKMWLIAKENDTINKLIGLMDGMRNVLGTIILFILVVVFCMFVKKIYLIWLNSDRERAQRFALKHGKETYSTKMRDSNIKLSGYYLEKEQIQEEISAMEGLLERSVRGV